MNDEFLDPHPIVDSIQKTRDEKPSQFTIGGSWDGHKITGGATYDRHWSNGWGLTAYARAWWDDLPVKPHATNAAIGFEAVKKF